MLEEDLWIGVSILFKKRNCIWVFAIVSWIKSTWEILNYKIQLSDHIRFAKIDFLKFAHKKCLHIPNTTRIFRTDI